MLSILCIQISIGKFQAAPNKAGVFPILKLSVEDFRDCMTVREVLNPTT